MLKRFISWLVRMAGVNLQEIVKKELLIVAPVIDLEIQSNEKRIDLLLKAHELHENEFFQLLLRELANEQITATVYGAETKEQLWVCRAHLVLLDNLRDLVNRYDSQWQVGKDDVSFDKHSII